MIGVTADSNIYISALHFGGIPRQFLIGAQRGRFRLDISMPIVLEFQRILRVKFSWTEAELQRQSALLSRITTTARPTQTIDAVPDDPDDNRVLECAVAANSRYVVTGDNHLLRLGSFAGIQIIKVADFMGLLPS